MIIGKIRVKKGGANSQEPQPEPREPREGDCPYCFQEPCVTRRRHTFLGNGQRPCPANSGMRKQIYRNYWKVINNLKGWIDPRYIAFKTNVGGGEWVVRHRREVMPKCVLIQARDLYPNELTQPYMDHKWE